MEQADMRHELEVVLEDIDHHTSLMIKALDAVKNSIRSDAALTSLDDLRRAVSSFTSGRKSTERAKSLIKARVLERIKG